MESRAPCLLCTSPCLKAAWQGYTMAWSDKYGDFVSLQWIALLEKLFRINTAEWKLRRVVMGFWNM
eukprot:373593-Amphidinium_carterae.1